MASSLVHRSRPLLLAALVVGALFVAGCGDDEETAAPATTASSTGCTPATTDLMTPLANKLNVENGRLSNGQIVKSAQHEDVYFVSAEIDSPQMAGSGDVGTWATTSPNGAEGIYSVNPLALKLSGWRPATVIDVAPDDPAAAESQACVFR